MSRRARRERKRTKLQLRVKEQRRLLRKQASLVYHVCVPNAVYISNSRGNWFLEDSYFIRNKQVIENLAGGTSAGFFKELNERICILKLGPN